jgi:hypothetical protein
MGDVVHFGLRSHVVGGNRIINVSAAAAARRVRGRPVGWGAILTKALGLVAQRWPELRRSYLPYPWPHLYEHPHCVATAVIERVWRGEHAVFFEQILAPEHRSVFEIDRLLREMKTAPVDRVGGYRRLIRFARLPTPLRRLIFWLTLPWWGRKRSRYFGTFSINSIPARRTWIMQSTTPLTFSLFYGVVEPGGDMMIQVLVDHRVIDGMAVGRLVGDLQAILDNEIVAELTRDDPAGDPSSAVPRARAADPARRTSAPDAVGGASEPV